MSTEKRMVLFVVLAVLTMTGMNLLLDRMGLLPKPKPKPRTNVAKVEKPVDVSREKEKETAVAEAETETETEKETALEPGQQDEARPEERETSPVAKVAVDKLHIGSTRRDSGYHLLARFTQRAAGIDTLASSQFEAEFEEGQPKNRPLYLIKHDPLATPSFALLSLTLPNQKDEGEGEASDQVIHLDDDLWEVLPDDQGRLVRPILAQGKASVEVGQEIHFQLHLTDPELTITKVFRLLKGRDGLELDLDFESPSQTHTIAYRLMGPHGVPIEGEWYTSIFRDVFFGQISEGAVSVATQPASTVVDQEEEPERFRTLPLKYVGVENQYFAVFLEPEPTPTTEKNRIDEAVARVIHHGTDKHKSDVAVEVASRPFPIGPNRSASHEYLIYAGPKIDDNLIPYGAEDLAKYRKGWSFDMGASRVSVFIAWMLKKIYALTEAVAHVFGFSKGNYGLAIILLTITVRLMLFPLSRKQAIAAKKMQDLQPLMTELKEKHKDDKEAITRETFALYKRQGVNPMGGCLPALIQLPILMGLWQALNNTVALRHSSFLWIDNLAAPDMLFKFPFEIPIVGRWLGPYFNVLPLIVVGLMLVQTKLFSPPATTPEAETQQKMMKFMMVFMMFMFYKVPSGLGIYFITSSLWAVGERKLLPRIAASKTAAPTEEPSTAQGSGGGRGGAKGTPPKGGKPAVPASPAPTGNGSRKGGWWSEAKERARERIEQLMEDASNDKTYRNPGDRSDKPRERDRGKPRPRPDRRR